MLNSKQERLDSEKERLDSEQKMLNSEQDSRTEKAGERRLSKDTQPEKQGHPAEKQDSEKGRLKRNI